MIVMKFGGSSVKTAEAMQTVADIVQRYTSANVLLVLSACGGITDKLLQAASKAAREDIAGVETLLSEINAHHVALCHTLFTDSDIRNSAITQVESLLSELRVYCEGISLLCECTPQSLDAIASFGERLSTCIFSYVLRHQNIGCVLHDARTTMITDSNFTKAVVHTSGLRELAQQLILPAFQDVSVVVTQGFVGANASHVTTTLGRGGSDLSAALYGAALDADEIQIWTDVNGILSADPRLVPTAMTLAEISFAEVRQLSYFGAKVLHPDTIKPALDRNIPVRILNTFQSDHSGTVVVHQTMNHLTKIRAVSVLRNCSLVREVVSVQSSATQNLSSLLLTAAEHHVEVLACCAEESTLALLVHAKDAFRFEHAGRTISSVDVLCACGPDLNHGSHIANICSALNTFNPEMVLYGTSNTSVLAFLHPQHSVQALQAVHSLIHQE